MPESNTHVATSVSTSVTQVGTGQLTLTVQLSDPSTGKVLREAVLDPVEVGDSGQVQISIKTETSG